MNVDRISGICLLILGIGLFFFIIPNQVEVIDYGVIVPNSLPNILSYVIIIMSVILIIKPSIKTFVDLILLAKVVFFVALVAIAAYFMQLFSFLIISPIFALSIMLLVGERRMLWLVLGTAILPPAIWAIVTLTLGRQLM